MKKRNIFLLIITLLLIIPISVKAEEKEKVKVYMFRSNTCGYCKNALAWFDSIKEEYGKYFELITFEVSESPKNYNNMKKVKEYFKVASDGVPYIVLGQYDYPNGFDSNTTLENNITMGEDLINKILELYNNESKFDIFEELNIDITKKDNSLVVGIVSGIVLLTIVGGIIIARKN